jgi:hypothetical protein
MTSVPLGQSAYERTYGQEPEVALLNRFHERTPTNQVEQSVLLARPGDTFFTGAGEGPIRKLAHQPGAFDGDLFFVSGEELFRYDGTTITPIIGTLQLGGNPSTTFVAGPGFEHLFITDGQLLQFYDGPTAATSTLTVSGGNIVATDVIQVDAAFYEYTAGSVDAGTPMGTVGDPYLIALGASDTDALLNTLNALNLTGIAGTDYSTATQINVNVEGTASDATTLDVAARVRGSAGDLIDTTETGANIAWTGLTLSGGGIEALKGIATPDDVAYVSLMTLAQFALLIVANSQRFYWIQPGATTIDALDFAEAESEPDELIEGVRIGDSAWMVGQTSTEVWYKNTSTDLTASDFIPQQGLAFSQGGIEGSLVPVRTQAYLVAEDGIVYQIVGGPRRISTNGIEERIRLARAAGDF